MEYHIIDLEDKEYQIVLGRRWLAEADPDMIFSAGVWRYRKVTPKITVEEPKRFKKSMRKHLTMLVMYRPEPDGGSTLEIPEQY
jgi:hypothetical protein